MAEKKTIAIISTLEGVPWGGSEELWMQTALAAVAAGHQVTVSMMGEPREHAKLSTLTDAGVHLRFSGTLRYITDSFFLRVRRKLTGRTASVRFYNRFAWLDEQQPDVILINASTAISLPHFPDLMEWMKATSLPFQTIIHHHAEHGMLTGAQASGLRTVSQKAQQVHVVALRNLQVLERQLAALFPKKNLVQNPVSVREAKMIPFPKWDILRIAVVARLDCTCKGQDILLEALANFEVPMPFSVTFYGDGPDRAYLERLVAFYRLETRVTIAGHVNGMEKIWAENHILLLPSLSEGTPISLVEAMLCGRPAMVTDVGDNARLIVDGKNGYVIPAATVAAIRNQLKRAIDNHGDWQRMGEQALNNAAAAYADDPAQTFLKAILAPN